MIRKLRVSNYAIIDHLELEFDQGFNVFTGETGAGKSIIIGALGFAVGERVTEDVIRKDADSVVVEADFEVPRKVLERMRSEGIGVASQTITIARELVRNGRSKSWINGRAASLAEIRSLGEHLIDFHGQHEHQRILNTSTHVLFLDAFSDLEEVRQNLRESRLRLKDLRRKLNDLESKLAEFLRNEPLLRHDVEELERLNLKPNEDTELEAEIRLLENKERIVCAAAKAIDDLFESHDSAISKMASALTSLRDLSSYLDQCEEMSNDLEQAMAVVKEIAQLLREKVCRIDLDEGMLEKMRERLAAIERLKRRYDKPLAQLIDYASYLKATLESKADLEAEIAQTRAMIAGVEADLLRIARDLSRKRKASAKLFESQIKQQMLKLGIGSADFKVVFDEIDDGDVILESGQERIVVGENGADYIEFFIRTNVGEDLHPLRRIASGGEISRIMLAIKKVLAGADQVETLVFDEIDLGVGGGLAEVIGKSLKDLAAKRQVICITHLAQIAAMADRHFSVSKAIEAKRTITRVEVLSRERRIEELARMIGGRKPPKSAIEHAEQLLRKVD